jgi:hypothetical protein
MQKVVTKSGHPILRYSHSERRKWNRTKKAVAAVEGTLRTTPWGVEPASRKGQSVKSLVREGLKATEDWSFSQKAAGKPLDPSPFREHYPMR